MACRRLEQFQDQEGQSEHQQAANPQEDHDVFAAQYVGIQQVGAFIRPQKGWRPFTAALAVPLKRDKPKGNQDQTSPEKAIAVLDGCFPLLQETDDQNNHTGNDRKQDNEYQDAQDGIFHGRLHQMHFRLANLFISQPIGDSIFRFFWRTEPRNFECGVL